MKLRSIGSAAIFAAVAFATPLAAQQGTGSEASGAQAAQEAAQAAQAAQPPATGGIGFAFEELSRVPEGRALLAMTTPDYPVTPGDTYSLNFLISADLVSTTLVVDTDYNVNLGIFGSVSGRGLSFDRFKQEVVQRVDAAYPGSSPRLIIRSTGVFRVQKIGEVAQAGFIQVWGLSRLSSVLDSNKTPYTSDRSIRIRSEDGTELQYDLFKARRYGDLSQDPYLHPGDAVVFSRAERIVTLSGEVYRPGVYQIIHGEGLKELVETYGEGFLPTARRDQAILTHPPTEMNPLGEVLVVNIPQESSPEVLDGDSLSIPSLNQYLPVVYFEGAIRMGTETAGQYSVDRQQYREGLLLSQSLAGVAARILPNADLKRAFIARKGRTDVLPVDLERLLYAYDVKDDIALAPEDRIVIPAGSLDVFVTGEVAKSSWVNTSPLMRLSDAISPLLTKYSSIRDVRVRGENGDERTYDLFRAERYGELEQNPLVRPGDTITVNRLERSVEIGGEVKRPGIYQLLPGEELRELVEVYAEGFTPKANVTRITVLRFVSTANPVGEKVYVSYLAQPDFEAKNLDSYSVPPLQELLPVVYFEGAIGVGVNGEDPQAARRIVYTFYPGEKVSNAAQVLRKQFSAVSDIEKAYFLRGEQKIAVNLAKFLFDKDFSDDISFEPNDIVIIPFRQFFVSVAGSVKIPGRYPYVPDRTWQYYVNLAGGIDKDKNSGDELTISSVGRKIRGKGEQIEPEDSIVVASNSFLYIFGQISAILTTTIAIASLVISLLR